MFPTRNTPCGAARRPLGDGDFDLLLEKLYTDFGVSTEVNGVPALTAGSLINAAGVWHPIEEDPLPSAQQ